MARMIRHEHAGPIRLEPQDKPYFICACGLSQNLPHCDASHKNCKAEQEGTLYVYDKTRSSITSESPDDE
ncbi:MAG: CDGSH iron-sulfur domain-containing protein [Planctomycetota bacterium]|jgi:CDGSH-type Zn-finger protein